MTLGGAALSALRLSVGLRSALATEVLERIESPAFQGTAST